jgi:hypothetical protein
MKLFFLVLNKTEKIDELLRKFASKKLCDATVVESMGMARMLSRKYDDNEIPMLASLRQYLNPERTKNYTVFAVIEDDKLQEIVETIESVVGDLSSEDTGVVFSVPIDYTKGICGFGK